MSDANLTIADFLAYDKQLMGKLGRIGDDVSHVREQVHHLNPTFIEYRAEMDAFRIQTRQDFAQVQRRLAEAEESIHQHISMLEQKVTRGFALLFTHLGITQSQ